MSGNSSHRQFIHHHEFLGTQDLHLQSPFSIPLPPQPEPMANNVENHSSDSNKELSPEKTIINHPTRRPRGRPSGSKNKPTPPTIVTRDTPNALRAHVLEVLAGNDVLESLSNYAIKRGRGVSVIGGSGYVTNVTLRQNVNPPIGSVVNFPGRFELLSLTGTVLPPPAPPGAGGLSVFLAGGGQGQVVGGLVMGRLIASSTVVIMAASFANAVFEKLSLDDDQEENAQPDASVSQFSGGNYFSGEHNLSGNLSGWGGNSGGRPNNF